MALKIAHLFYHEIHLVMSPSNATKKQKLTPLLLPFLLIVILQLKQKNSR